MPGVELDLIRRALGLGRCDLWLAYVALGGRASATELADYLSGKATLDEPERAVLAHALTEHATFGGRGVSVEVHN